MFILSDSLTCVDRISDAGRFACLHSLSNADCRSSATLACYRALSKANPSVSLVSISLSVSTSDLRLEASLDLGTHWVVALLGVRH